MLEMTVTSKIVILSAGILILGGYVYLRHHSRRIADKYKQIQKDKFKTKEPVIIEEILAQLNIPNQHGLANESGILRPTIPLEPTTISTPLRLPPQKVSQNVSQPTTGSLTKNSKKYPESLKLRSPNTPPQTRGQWGGNQGHVNQGIQFEPVNYGTTSHAKNNALLDETEPPLPSIIRNSEPILPIRKRGNAISQELIFQEDETLYTHINDYAKWVASQSEKFILEHYENGVPIESISLIFNREDLERLNGHWFNLFQPQNLSEILSELNVSNTTLYCPFTSSSVEQLCKPALQILAYADFEASPRYNKVIEECALKEFVTYLQELKTMTNSDAS